MGDRVERDAHGERLARHERDDAVVALAMREVELAPRHEQRGAAGQQLAQPHARERKGAVAHEDEIGLRVPEQLDRLLERRRVEAERAPVVGALVERQVVGVAVRAPGAAVEAGGLGAQDLEHGALARRRARARPARSRWRRSSRCAADGQVVSAIQRPGRSS